MENQSPDSKRERRFRQANTDALKIDRLPPHSIEAEQGVLGCCLLDPKNALNECQSKGIRGDMFYDLRHQVIYDALAQIFQNQPALDMIGVSQYLKDRKELEGIGGPAYLSSLVDVVPSAWNLPMYLGMLKEKYVLRRMLALCGDTAANIYEHEGEVQGILDWFETQALAIGDSVISAKDTVSMKELVREAIDQIERSLTEPNHFEGIRTGFHDLDHYFRGLKNGNMYVLAARPSIGKTSLAMNIADHVAVVEGLPVGVFSLEMTKQQLTMRMMAARSRINLSRQLLDEDTIPLTNAGGRLSKAPIHIDDTPGLSIMQLRARARRMVQRYGVKLFVIDYLQLMNNGSRRGEKREQEISQVSNGVKAMAKELDVPVIVLSQLNRDIEKNKNRKPMLSDLRDSGSIEQDADGVMMLYNQKSDEENENSTIIPVNCLIAKNRGGATGEVHLTFFKEFTRFEPCQKMMD